MRISDSGAVTNWAGNITYGAARIHRPASLDEVRAAVAGAAEVRALGTGHSFNPIADTPGDLVSVAGLPRRVEIDAARATVTVSAGLRYAELAAELETAGLALANMASLPHISVAGACATGTHGSGDANGSLATSVTGLQFVTADGDVVELSRDADGDRFAGAVVNLGALGVVTAMTLDVLPSFQVAQYVYEGFPVDSLGERIEDVFGAGYSVSVFTNWLRADARIWRKLRADGSDPAAPARWLDARLAGGPRHPVPGMPAEFATEQGGVPGPWLERLPHFRPDFTPSNGEELQSEFFVPRGAAPRAVAALRSIGDVLAPVLQISEVRTIRADDLWLSPCHGRDSVAFHFTWIADLAAVTPALAAVEAALGPLGARVHWGKVFTADPATLPASYPRAADFRHLAEEYDPHGKFRNRFLAEVFGSR